MRNRGVLLLLALGVAAPVAARPARADGPEDRRSPIVKAVEKARPGVVSIRTNEMVLVPKYYNWFDYEEVPQERSGSLGSGAIFHPQGFVITNAHVISRASGIFVQVSDPQKGEYEREAKVVSVDLDNDLAILRLLGPPPGGEGVSYPWLPLGRSDDLLIGETVLAIGNPFRLGLTVTTGIVSALRRSIRPQREKETEFRDFIQTDAAINPGNSGGPLLDVNGRWIGVNTAILNRAMGAEGIGFAIPADRVRDMVGRLFKRRAARGDWLGLDLETGPGGVPVVKEVSPLGPSAGLPLAKGDRVLALDGTPTPSLYDYRLAEVSLASGATVKVRFAHGDAAPREVAVTLQPLAADVLARRRLGFLARALRPEDARSLGATSGIVVTEVVAGGPASRVGIEPDDVVLSLGSMPMRGLDDLSTFLEMLSAGDSVDLRISRVVDRGGGRRRIEAPATLIAG
jgi:S1-C subfamily serine protease